MDLGSRVNHGDLMEDEEFHPRDFMISDCGRVDVDRYISFIFGLKLVFNFIDDAVGFDEGSVLVNLRVEGDEFLINAVVVADKIVDPVYLFMGSRSL